MKEKFLLSVLIEQGSSNLQKLHSCGLNVAPDDNLLGLVGKNAFASLFGYEINNESDSSESCWPLSHAKQETSWTKGSREINGPRRGGGVSRIREGRECIPRGTE